MPRERFRSRLIPVVLLWFLAVILLAASVALVIPMLGQFANEGWQPPNPEKAFSLGSTAMVFCSLIVSGCAFAAGYCWLRGKWKLAVLATGVTLLLVWASPIFITVVIVNETGRT
jgi:hypothetical protein